MYLEVYISGQSPEAQELLLIAEQASQVPGLEVSVVNMDDPEQRRTPLGKSPVALLDDRVVSVEPPAWSAFLEELREETKENRQPRGPSVRGGRRSEARWYQTPSSPSSLLAIDLFSDLGEEDIQSLRREMTEQFFAKGQIIYLQEEQAQELFLLKKGRVQTYRLTTSGKRLELTTVPAGTFFGEVPLLERVTHHATAEATEDAVLGVVRRSALERMIRERPTIALRMIHELSRRIALSARRLEEFAYQSAPTRLVAELLRLQQSHPDNVIPITHQELGEITGLLRETVTKLLNEFKAAGLVELRRGHILLKDSARLQALIREFEMTHPHSLEPISSK
ncbi:MAG TPA: Crp/Fnr family transcriptional regulator [Ktedonobacterales bacterium]